MSNPLTKLNWWSSLFAVVLAVIVLFTCAVAQDQPQQGDDPPSRVARLGYMEGAVSFQPAGEQDWVGAVPNRPMTIGDKLWADKGSRVELQLGSAVIRLSENTGINFLNLDDHTIQVQLSSGAVSFRVRQLDQADSFEVDIPNLAFSLYQPGNYRVEASEDGSNTVVTVREGDGEATGNGQSYKIHTGQRTTFSGTNSLEADTEQIGAPDQFDAWAASRDNRWEHSRSSQYVPQDMVGYDDLDDNGDWRDDG
jgi:ferric-dicitrate binding protein FerR (iron transport regulator)